MEIQSDKFKADKDKQIKVNGYNSSFIAQQRGLNDRTNHGLAKYARIMFETSIADAGDYDKLNSNPSKYSQSDINALSSAIKSQTEMSFYNTGLKLLTWNGINIGKASGMTYVNYSYKRQLNDSPPVIVSIYLFQNYDRIHQLTFSYRLNEKDYWQSDFDKILKSFRITHIKYTV